MHGLDLPAAAVDASPYLTPIPGGFCVKVLADGDACIDVLRMMFNWRVVVSPRSASEAHITHIAGFCYYGHGVDGNGTARTMMSASMAAIGAAWLWDGHGEPAGYDKVAFDGRREYEGFG